MKRIPCFLLTALMLLLCTALTAGAQEQPLAVAVSGVNGEAGETVTVEVTLKSNPGITSLKLSLSYDATVLTLVESEKTNLFDGWYQASPTTETLPYLMVWVAAEAQNETGTLIRLQFRIAENATVETVSSPTLTVEEAFCDGVEISADPVRFDISVICRHTYGAYASVDDSEHKRECAKCHGIEKTAHAWDAGVVTKPATHLETGMKTVTCTDCGATKEETVPITDESKDSSPSWVIPVIIAVLAVLIVAGVIVLLLMKRRGSHPIPTAPTPTAPMKSIGDAPKEESAAEPHVDATVAEKATEDPADAMEKPANEGTVETIADEFAPQSADGSPCEAPEITAEQSEEVTDETEPVSADPDTDIVEEPAPAVPAESIQKDPDITTSENPTSETEATPSGESESESDKEEIPIIDEQEEFKQ